MEQDNKVLCGLCLNMTAVLMNEGGATYCEDCDKTGWNKVN